MSVRPPKPEGALWIIPYITVRDVDAALAFYERAFGFQVSMKLPGKEGKTMHGEVKWKDATIMMGPECETKTPAVSGVESPMGLYLYVDEVESFHAHAVKEGAASVGAPETMFWGDRMCRLKDPDGYVWSFATNVEDFDPSKVPSC